MPGLIVKRHFTNATTDVFDMIAWKQIDVEIRDEKNEVIYVQKDVEAPGWMTTQNASICVNKYFYGEKDAPDREISFKQMYTRVVTIITRWGILGGYFADNESVEAFFDELLYLVMTGRYIFNSPVWFNLGNPYSRPQASACFINGVEDNLENILDLIKREGIQFKYGSGAGSDMSAIRSKKETLAGGGSPSGPVSFMRGLDRNSGTIKSGGKTRRAAKLVCLKDDHPDIIEFINHKSEEEKKAKILIAAGYDARLDGEAYATVDGQNANNSVRVSDAFMNAALGNRCAAAQNQDEAGIPDQHKWCLTARTTGKTIEIVNAKEILRLICQRAWETGCPGIQFDDTINRFNKVPSMGRKNATNPCSEFDNVNDTSCNLASMNLRKFQNADGSLMVQDLGRATRIGVIAQDIIVGDATGSMFEFVTEPYGACYPTPLITQRTQQCRPIGLGYCNLGAFIMCAGLPYDSDEGRTLGAAVTAYMMGQAWLTSARMAQYCGGAFPAYREEEQDREAIQHCLAIYANHAQSLIGENGAQHELSWLKDDRVLPIQPDLADAIDATWDLAHTVGKQFGYRNNEVGAIAPTGTIVFLMGGTTTSGEPAMALIQEKKLVGGGFLVMVNEEVGAALAHLKYDSDQITSILAHIEKHGTVEGSAVKNEHLAIFDCALKSSDPLATRTITTEGHVRMLAALQTFVSMAISKTVNLPESATVEDFENTYLLAWRLGCKSVAAYRDNSKGAQPVSAGGGSTNASMPENQAALPWGTRKKLPPTRVLVGHGFSISGLDGYFQVGIYPDTGQIGELFIETATQGSPLRGLLDSFAIAVSLGLQHGVPLSLYERKFEAMSFPPNGWTGDADIPRAASVVSFIFQWIRDRYPIEAPKAIENLYKTWSAPVESGALSHEHAAQGPIVRDDGMQIYDPSAPMCINGHLMTRITGHCFQCTECGDSQGGCGA